jgi:hypothetical protein
MVAGSAAVKPGDDFEEPFAMILGPFIYAFIANACYTLGWIADTLSSQTRQSLPVADNPEVSCILSSKGASPDVR